MHPICNPVLQALQNLVQISFPHAIVVLRKGGDELLAVAMMMNSGVVICTASTFCFFSSILNTNGLVYLPEKLYYNVYFVVDNIMVMNNFESVHVWSHENGKYDERNITSDIALQILLRNKTSSAAPD